MIKLIVKSNGTKVGMNFEEVINDYTPLVVKIAKKYKGIYLSEDDMQEGLMSLWKAFSTYDEVHCFSTYATYVVSEDFQNLKNYETAKMRNTMGKQFLNMEYDLGDGNQLGDMIADDSSSFEQSILDMDILEYIKSNLSDMEMDLLAYNLGYVKGTSLAQKYGIGKSGISNRNAKFKIKFKQLIEKYNRD